MRLQNVWQVRVFAPAAGAQPGMPLSLITKDVFNPKDPSTRISGEKAARMLARMVN
jgi:hypothetical protein